MYPCISLKLIKEMNSINLSRKAIRKGVMMLTLMLVCCVRGFLQTKKQYLDSIVPANQAKCKWFY